MELRWVLGIFGLVALSCCSDGIKLEDKRVENAIFAMVGEEPPHDVPALTEPSLHDKLMAKAGKNLTAPKTNLTELHHGHAHHDHDHDHEHHNHNDHSGDHAAHNHEAHDHSGHMMMMWFHGGCKEVILFDFWRIDSCLGLVTSCFAIFIMGALYEGLKWFRVYLTLGKSKNSSGDQQEALPQECHGKNKNIEIPSAPMDPLVNASSRSVTPVTRNQPGPFSPIRITQALLYIIQLVLAYWLMLIVMTYNTWLTIAVILGAGFGHWVFAALRFANPSGEAADCIATDACH
uniref:Copper transport protein n=1 Tax=Caenorhabditis japonica TaxID=281687 RepID=A0A8R1HZD4_CAEJA